METVEPQYETRDMMLNMGPQHPAMHGIIRVIVKLDGETVKDVDVEIGYLHRCFEKMSEQGGYHHVIPYTDRLNYVSPLINNVGYCMAVEKLMGITVPERGQYIRTIVSEISRITDHLTCIGASAMELGAFTVFLYMIKAREYLWELVEFVTGARLTISYCRVGGVKADLPEGFEEKTRSALTQTREVLKEVDKLLTRNRIFVDRMKGTGRITGEEAVNYGITGPFLRSTGVNYDVRKAQPYLIYDRIKFEVPLGQHGDNLDRYFVRMEEMEQSMRIIEQCFEQMPKGAVQADEAARAMPAADMVDEAKMGRIPLIRGASPVTDPVLEGSNRAFHNQVNAPDKRAILPPKEDTYGNIEGLMQHFKLIMYGHGIRPPKGEVYQPVEGANGELGFFVVSDGTDKPYRVRCRPPCLPIMSALGRLVIGDMMADIVPTFGSINMIGGELDR
ncbi:MAG: NADH-quinone oxidoreductase subunit D [Candidatus Omnitrophica bacterium]|nr:NADH-quinone oxidoreductase subunit D [Candidatus Omnitrophota bacterium]